MPDYISLVLEHSVVLSLAQVTDGYVVVVVVVVLWLWLSTNK